MRTKASNTVVVRRGERPCLLAFCAILATTAFCDPEDVAISESGTTTFTAGSAHGALRNEASGEVTLASSGAATESDAISFTNFDAVAGASTTFSGGWWDFGADSLTEYPTNFFSSSSTLSDRTTTFDNGAVVTNIGCAYLAGASGTDNALNLKGASSLTLTELVFGRAQKPQRSSCRITEGSSLHCLKSLSMSEGAARDNVTKLTGNELVVSGEGSSLQVDGVTYLGRDLGYNYNGGLGGSTLAVSNNATADFLGGIIMNDAVVHGMRNHVVFSDGARVTMTSFQIDYHWSSTSKTSSNVVEILSGAVVTNTGPFTCGVNDNDVSHAGNSLLISNATFVTKAGVYGSSTGLFCGPHMTVRLSGADAKLEFTGGFPSYFFSKTVAGTFILEDKASFDYRLSYLAMVGPTISQRIIIRDGSTMTVPNGFKICANDNTGYDNIVQVLNDSRLSGAGVISVSGPSNTLEVVDGAVGMAYYFYVGCTGAAGSSGASTGTNCLVNISGTHPSIRSSWSMHIRNGSVVRFNLPAQGYDDGYAVPSNAIMRVSSDGAMTFDESSKVELTGAEEMLEYHREHKKRARYVLLSTPKTANALNLSAEQVQAIQNTLPEGMTVEKVVQDKKNQLVLDVHPKWGFTLIVK